MKRIINKIIKPKVLMVLGLMVIIIIGGIYFWLRQSLSPEEEVYSYLEGDENVEVAEAEAEIKFWPRERLENSRGIIFYPGPQVEAAAYAGLAWRLAEKGYPVILAEMPFQMAVLNWGRAGEIIEVHDEIESWILAGHSLGGAMSVRFVHRSRPADVEAMILLASYPRQSADISEKDLDVLSLYGSEDEVIDRERLQERKELLPPDARLKELEGANHAGFGQYGEQGGDGKAEISGSEQRRQTAEMIIEFLQGN